MRKRYHSLQKMDKAHRFLIFSVILGIITGVAALLSQLFASQLFGWQSTVFKTETELSFKPFLNINVTNIPLSISVYEGNSIKINYVNETELFIEDNDYSYTLSQNPDFVFSLFALNQFDYKLEILLPDRGYDRISVTTTSGSVELQDINVSELYVSSRSGNVAVLGSNGGVSAVTTNADINITFADYTANSLLESISGDINVVMPHTCKPNIIYNTETGYFFTDFYPSEPDIINKRIFPEGGGLTLGDDAGTATLSVKTVGGRLSLLGAHE